MICAPSLEKRYYHRGAVGGCAKHADLAVGLRDVLDQPVDGVPAPLEPKRGKGLKVQDVTRVFWPRGTLRWCSERTWGGCGG